LFLPYYVSRFFDTTEIDDDVKKKCTEISPQFTGHINNAIVLWKYIEPFKIIQYILFIQIANIYWLLFPADFKYVYIDFLCLIRIYVSYSLSNYSPFDIRWYKFELNY